MSLICLELRNSGDVFLFIAIGSILLFNLIKDFIYSIPSMLFDFPDISNSPAVRNLLIAYSLAFAKDIPSFKLSVIISQILFSLSRSFFAITFNSFVLPV